MNETKSGAGTIAGQAPVGLAVLPPLMALIEILVLIVLPGLLDYLWPGFPSLAETQPHFFWLPVLLLSLQYGTVSGLLAAGVAITLSALLGWPDQEVGENHFNYLLRIWAQPVLWLTAALVLGQFRMRQIERKQELARQVAELSTQRTAISDYATNLRSRCEMLEREIAGRRDPSVRSMLTALAGLKAGGQQASPAFAECLDLAFGSCAASVYRREGDQLVLAAAHGVAAARAEVMAANTPLVRAITTEGRQVSVLNPGDEAMLAGAGVVAVPVFSSGDGRVLGMLKLETLPAGDLDDGTPASLAVIAAELTPLFEKGGIGLLNSRAPGTPSAGPPLSGASGIGPPGIGGKASPAPRQRLWRQLKWQRHAARGSRPKPQSMAGE